MTLATWQTRASHPRNGVKPLIGITMGDPAGIGAEVIVKALADPTVRELGRFVVYGIESRLIDAAKRAGIKPCWFSIPRGETARIDSGVVVTDFNGQAPSAPPPPRPTADGGRASLLFLDAAVEDARSGSIDAVVTAPVSKTSWKLAGCPQPGHTERLAAAFNVTRYTMLFVGGGMRVALASTHLNLFELRNQFTIGLVFQPIDMIDGCLRRWFGIATPRIAVAGLNPHAGEDGLFGDEEQRIIEPAIQMARSSGIQADGPFPADTLFTPQRRNLYDGIVCMYHDQGLIPIKMVAFDTAVNVTLGLPIIRTSVDHGTAFDIADTNAADPGSMKEAIRLGCRFVESASSTHARPQAAAISAQD
jgi:4-hydroxythreonine-4-phosphate dehydrogenase